MREANLQGANLRDADLEGADLTNAIVDNADFTNATLRDTKVIGTQLKPQTIQKNLSELQLKRNPNYAGSFEILSSSYAVAVFNKVRGFEP